MDGSSHIISYTSGFPMLLLLHRPLPPPVLPAKKDEDGIKYRYGKSSTTVWTSIFSLVQSG